MRRYLFDNNLSLRAARAIKALKDDVCHVREVEELGGACSDEAWIDWCRRNGFVAFSHDRNIKAKPNQRAALKTSGVTIFWFPKRLNRMSPEEQVMLLLRAWKNIEEAVDHAKPGHCWFVIRENGKLEAADS